MKRAQKKIAIIGDKENSATIRKTLNDNFTAAELNRLTAKKDMVVLVQDTPRGSLGYFRRRTRDLFLEDICIKPGSREDTITHEFVHALRNYDPTRTGYSETTYPKDGNGFIDERWRDLPESKKNEHQCIEEAATVAETTARTRFHALIPTGYYSRIPNGTGKELDNYGHDRKTLLGKKKSDNEYNVKGLKGRSAIDKVNKRFEETKISDLEYPNKKYSAKECYKRLRP